MLDFSEVAALFYFQQSMRIPVSLYPCWHLLLLVLLIISILLGVKWSLLEILNYFPYDYCCWASFCLPVRQLLLIYLLWRNVYSDPLLIFKLGWSFYCSYKSSLHYLDTRLLYIILKCFLPFCGLSFHFLHSILWSTNILNVEEVQFIFLFACTFGDISKILLPNPVSQRLTPLFCSKRERFSC